MEQFGDDMRKALKTRHDGPNMIANLSIQFDFTFDRDQPDTAKTAKNTQIKELDYTLLHDCLAA